MRVQAMAFISQLDDFIQMHTDFYVTSFDHCVNEYKKNKK